MRRNPLQLSDQEKIPLRILLACGGDEIRCEWKSILNESMPWVDVVAEAKDGREAVELAVEYSPRIVMMDFAIPVLSCVDCTRQIKFRTEAGIVILADRPDSGSGLDVIPAGANAVLPRSPSEEELALAINAVIAGRIYLTPDALRGLIDGFLLLSTAARRNEVAGRPFPALTERQREVLKYLAEGATTKDLAQRLHISARTVETHRVQLMNRLDIHNTAELTKYAIRAGLTSL